MDWQALFLSLRLASLCALILLLVGLPLTFYLSLSDRAWVGWVEALFSLPMVLPPTVLGFYLLFGLRSTQISFFFRWIAFSLFALEHALCFPIFSLGLPPRRKRFLRNLVEPRESSWMTFVRVAIPLAKEGLAAGAILAFAHTLGEFGVVLMIGGNIPGVSRTLAISLYDQVESLEYEAAARTALVLLAFSVVAMVLISAFRRKLRTS